MGVRAEQRRLADQRRKEAEAAKKLAEQADQRDRPRYAKAAASLEKAASVTAAAVDKVAKDFVKDSVKAVKSGNASVRDVTRKANEVKASIRESGTTRETQYKTAAGHLAKYSADISRILNDDLHASMLLFLQGDYGLTEQQIKHLRIEVESLVKRGERYAETLRKWKPIQPRESKSLTVVG
jgi:hypothetical protein